MNGETPIASKKRIIAAVTGASGAIYSKRLVECLCDAGVHVHLVVSPNGRRLLNDELGISEVDATTLLGHDSNLLTVHPYRDVGAVLASGSFHTDGMVVCPCSGNTLGAIAAGLGGNLIDRAAAVTLKENRRLILVPREMPMGRIEMLNLLRLNEAGAIVCPASPGFYMLPTSIADLVDFVVGKLLDLLGIPHRLNVRWADRAADAPSSWSSSS
ncbi:MAG: UbiX family flavin prenyltransferase [Planctomycetes bacterium]|nr:UbiX family flavin prenyltransferase [Planctomycetota bacterium]